MLKAVVDRRSMGVGLLAVSVAYSAADLAGWLHPRLLMLGVNGGPKRTLAVILGSISFKAVLLLLGAGLAFWPSRR